MMGAKEATAETARKCGVTVEEHLALIGKTYEVMRGAWVNVAWATRELNRMLNTLNEALGAEKLDETGVEEPK